LDVARLSEESSIALAETDGVVADTTTGAITLLVSDTVRGGKIGSSGIVVSAVG